MQPLDGPVEQTGHRTSGESLPSAAGTTVVDQVKGVAACVQGDGESAAVFEAYFGAAPHAFESVAQTLQPTAPSSTLM